MNSHINFEDNIFILNVGIRIIQDILILDIDHGLFFGKTMKDLEFIDQSLVVLFEGITQNERLFERDEQFYNLSETERVFCDLLFEMSKGKTGFSSLLDQEMAIKLSDMRNHSLERRRTIDERVAEFKTSSMDPIVGYEELHELLSG
jgi:hypothetical protein